VSEVRGAILDGPVLHGRSDDVGHLGIERLAPIDGPQQTPEDILREALAHDVTGEDVGAEDRINADGRTVGHGRNRHRIEASSWGCAEVRLTRREINEESGGW
jgi:hypothetical protein